MRVRSAFAVTLLIGAMTLAGCGGAAPDAADEGSEGRAGAPAEGGQQEPDGQPKLDVGKPAKDVVHTGELRLKVQRLDRAADQAAAIAEAADGFVGGDERESENGRASATLTLRIPATEFTASVTKIAKLGKELGRKIRSENVSDAVIDLDSRIAGQRASVKRIRALLDRAQSLGEISTVEQELTKRESELASLEARKRDLADRVAYSTLTVQMSTPAAPPRKVEPAEIGFVPGLVAGWEAYRVTVQVLLTLVGATLPFLVTLAAPVVVLVWLLRRRARSRSFSGTPSGPMPD